MSREHVERVAMVHQCITMLFRPDSRPEDVQRANQWLMTFSNTVEAWGVAGQLLSSASPQVQYFGANIFFTKAKNDHASLSPSDRASLRENILGFLKAGSSSAVCMRLAHALACISLRTPHGCTGLIKEMIPLAAIRPAVSLEVLCVLPEQLDRLDFTFNQREALTVELLSAVPDVLKTCNALMRQADRGEARMEARITKVLEVLANWQAVGISLAQLFSENTLQISLQAMQAMPHLLPNLSGVLVDALGVKGYPVPSGQAAATTMLGEALVQMRPLFEANKGPNGNLQLCRAIGQLAGAFCESEATLVAHGSPMGLQLLDLLLACTAHPDRGIVQDSLEFFACVNDIKQQDRCEQCRLPLFARLLQLLLPACMFPPGFRSWETHTPGFFHDMDEDAFKQYRESLIDSLLTCFFVLNHQYLEFVLSSLQQHQHWYVQEGLLFALKAVAADVKEAADDGEFTQQHEQLLSQAFRLILRIAEPPHTLVARAACACIGGYGFWLMKNFEMLQAAISYLLSVSGITDQAGDAFYRLCRAAKPLLSQNPDAVLQAVQADGRLGRMATANKRLFFAGLAHVISDLHGDPHKEELATRALHSLLSPLGSTIQAACQEPDTNLAAQAAVLDQLGMILAVFEERKQPFPRRRRARVGRAAVEEKKKEKEEEKQAPAGGSAAVAALDTCWPLICGCVDRYPGSLPVVELVCQVFEALLLSLHTLARPFLSAMASRLLDAFNKTRAPCCLLVLGRTVELFGDQPQAAQSFQGALTEVCAALQGVSDDPALYEALCVFCRQMMERCPEALVPALDHTLSLALGCIQGSQTRGCLRAALEYLKAAMDFRSNTKQELVQHVGNVVLAKAAEIVTRVVHGLAGDLVPRDLVSKMASVLYALLDRVPAEAFQGAFYQALARPDFPSKILTPKDKELILNIVCSMRTETENKFRALISDFSAICRAQNTAECLLAYQLK